MVKQVYLIALLIITLFFSSKNQISESSSTYDEESINEYVEHVMERHEIPGVALAIIKDGKVIHQKNYGKANLEHSVPISDKSIFRVYSLTKLFVATGVFQLIEENKLSLEDAISKFVPNLPASWKSIQIKHLLTHSSGLPDMAPYYDFQNLSEEEAKEKVFSQELKISIGEEYRYNQTNFWLLQRIIEKVSGQSFKDFIIKNQFDSNSKHAFFSSDSRIVIPNRCTAYFPFETGRLTIEHPHVGDFMHAANGMNITLNEFIAWDKKMKNNEIITSTSRQKMLSNFPYKNSNKKFTYGWDQRIVNGHVSYGFSGSLVTAYRIFPKDDLSIVFLSNGLGNFFDIENIINHLASIIDDDITDPNNFIFETLFQASQKNSKEDFKNIYSKLKRNEAYNSIDFEGQLNAVGYTYLRSGKVNPAIEIFQLNVQEYPRSWNVYDSYAEALEVKGIKKKALKNYSKALELNVGNQNDYNGRLKEKIKLLKEQL